MCTCVRSSLCTNVMCIQNNRKPADVTGSKKVKNAFAVHKQTKVCFCS